MQRVRLTYSKKSELLFTGNLDMHKIWERTFRRAGLRLVYSQGFHPQPKIQQACPLPLGFTSIKELLDLWLDSDEPIDDIKSKLEPVLHPGIKISEYEIVSLSLPPLQNLVSSSRYQVLLEDVPATFDLNDKITWFLNQTSCMHERRGKTFNLRPLIETLTLNKNEPAMLEMLLTARPGSTGRPEDVLDELGIPFSIAQIQRVDLLFSAPISG